MGSGGGGVMVLSVISSFSNILLKVNRKALNLHYLLISSSACYEVLKMLRNKFAAEENAINPFKGKDKKKLFSVIQKCKVS